MNKRKQTGMTPGAKAMLAMFLMVVCVGLWQMWADSGKAAQRTAHVDSDSLLKVVASASLPQQIVDYGGFTISFSASHHIPNYAAWKLTRDMTSGTAPRENQFYTDPAVRGCPETYDYSYSGYDRGHMCPAGDMKWSRAAMHNSFSLANICPQAKTLNTGAWKRLEEKCRQWAQADSMIVIICGPILTDRLRESIGDTRVSVPERFFKVSLSPGSVPMRGIGFIMRNGRVDGGMQTAAVTINQVEEATGLDFFSSLPDDIEDAVESQCDFPYWSTIRPSKKN